MKFLLLVLACAICAVFAAPVEKDLKGSEQVYLASPYAYNALPYAGYAGYAAAVPSYYPTAYASAYSAYPYSYYYR